MVKLSRKNRRPKILIKADNMNQQERLAYFTELANQKGYIYNKDYEKCRKKKNELTSNKCYICGGTAYCMHHIIPLYSNGKNRKRNLIPVCFDCHSKIHPFMNK